MLRSHNRYITPQILQTLILFQMKNWWWLEYAETCSCYNNNNIFIYCKYLLCYWLNTCTYLFIHTTGMAHFRISETGRHNTKPHWHVSVSTGTIRKQEPGGWRPSTWSPTKKFYSHLIYCSCDSILKDKISTFRHYVLQGVGGYRLSGTIYRCHIKGSSIPREGREQGAAHILPYM